MRLHVTTGTQGPIFWLESAYEERAEAKAAGFLWHGGSCRPSCGACAAGLARVWWTRRVEAAAQLAAVADDDAARALGGGGAGDAGGAGAGDEPPRSPRVEIADGNLMLAVLAALYEQRILPRPDLRALRKRHRPDVDDLDREPTARDDDYAWNGNLAERLGATPVTAAQMARLRAIQWPESFGLASAIYPQDDGEGDEFDIGSLGGLEHCAGLETLSLEMRLSPLRDLSPIAGLSRLRALRLGFDAQIADLRPLVGLTALRSLALSGPIVDLRPLTALAALEEVSLEWIRVIDPAPLLALPALKSLRLRWSSDHAAEQGPRREDAQALVDALAARRVALEIEWPWPGKVKPTTVARPAAPARNPALEARIAAAPDDDAGYAAYAQWLRSKGDPLGELIELDLQLAKKKSKQVVEARRSHWVAYEEHFLGTLKGQLSDAEWSRGVLRSALLLAIRPAALEAFLALPVARFLRELSLSIDPGSRKAVELLAGCAAPPPLRELDLRAADEIKTPIACEGLWKTYRGLQTLRLSGALGLGTIDLPDAVDVEVSMDGDVRASARSIAQARWPKLERLMLWKLDGDEAAVADLAPLFAGKRVPALERLEMYAIRTGPLCAALARSALLPQLARVQIEGMDSFGVSGDDAAVVLASADRFAHLEAFAFPIGDVGATERRALKALYRRARTR